MTEFDAQVKAIRPLFVYNSKKNLGFGGAAIVVASALLYKGYAHPHVKKLFNWIRKNISSMFQNQRLSNERGKTKVTLSFYSCQRD